jgi:hypothetical protein
MSYPQNARPFDSVKHTQKSSGLSRVRIQIKGTFPGNVEHASPWDCIFKLLRQTCRPLRFDMPWLAETPTPIQCP